MAEQYRILERIGTTGGSFLHRGERIADEAAVLIKLPLSLEAPADAERFRREYALMQGLDGPSVVAPLALVDQPDQLMMVLEPRDGILFEDVLAQQRCDVPNGLRLGIELARTLAAVHAARVIVQDFRPANLMQLPDLRFQLVDLHLATGDGEDVQLGVPAGGDWAYISPEQTGRLSRAIDFRTDYYSLGVILYRMLTGQLPCHGNDALEWTHCHLAGVPIPPTELEPGIPHAVSFIILKLLGKMPEDRYQSMYGLQADLEQCLRQWETAGVVEPFPLGRHDMDERLQVPWEMLDREAQLAQLRDNDARMVATGRPSLSLVTGDAGTGKSALVAAYQLRMLGRPGFFVAGKFEQYQDSVPYGTFTRALNSLVTQILAGTEEEVALWRRRIQDAVGTNGQLVTEVLPQLELVIGPQQPPFPMPAAESRQRFRMVFLKLVAVFAQQEHPLTLFLDDLHWADDASLQLVTELLTTTGPSWLHVIGAYREGEASKSIARMLEEVSKQDIDPVRIALGNLTEQEVAVLAEAMLHVTHERAEPLVHLLYQKTGGNPLFLGQFVATLAEEGAIAFDPAAKQWQWDLERIRAKSYTDNVVDLMIHKLGRLPAAARSLLQLLSCLGSEVPESLLIRVAPEPGADVRAALAVAAGAGLVFRAEGKVRFLHDRVQEAAYLSLTPDARAALHARIGRMLAAGKTPEEMSDSLFFIADQYNRGASAITDPAEKARLHDLNVAAGMKAKRATAIDAACSFLSHVVDQLPDDAWHSHYRETVEPVLALSECESFLGRFERADTLADEVLRHARTPRDAARVYVLRIARYQLAGRLDDAVASMVQGLRMFDIVIPTEEAAINAAIAEDMLAIGGLLQGRTIAQIAHAAPLSPGADLAAAIGLLTETIAASYMVKQDYFSLIVARAVRLSLEHGHTEDSCYAYSAFGTLLSRRGDIRSALEFSRMALELNDKLGGRRRKGNLLATHAIAYGFFTHPVREVLPMLEQATALSIEVGDLVYASYITMTYCWTMLQDSGTLDAVEQMARTQCDFARENRNDMVYQTIRFQQQLAANLRGRTRSHDSMDDDEFDEAACLAALEQASFGVGLQSSWIARQLSTFVYGDYAAAMHAAHQAALHSHRSIDMLMFDTTHHFLFGLSAAALYPTASPAAQREYAGILEQERQRYRLWADTCAQNFACQSALLDAEAARLAGRHGDAEPLYEQAIQAATAGGFVQNTAIAYELTASFYRGRGFGLIADAYLREAHRAYKRWGAEGKLAQLEMAYPALFAETAPLAAAPDRDAVRLDLLSIAKAAQAISSRLVLDELVDTLMHIVLENAGAQSGYLLLVREDRVVLAADARVERSQVQVNVHMDAELPEGLLPASIVNVVRRTHTQVLLPDVSQPSEFSRDPYFSGRRTRSVLCMPVLRQDVLVGMLYLESDLVTHAFAPERVAVLQVLASQAAISLENARLFAELEVREAKILRLFESNIVGIWFYDVAGQVTGANDAALSIIGYSREDLLAGRIHWPSLSPPEWEHADALALDELRRTGACKPFEKEYLRKDGGRVPVLTASAIFNREKGQAVAFAIDLTERKVAEAKVLHMANHDALTGLPNRTLLHDRLHQAISQAHRRGGMAAILFIDLDFFKYINDSLGHQFGDTVLRMAASRLQQCVREGDSVARLGGDEFVICLPSVASGGDVTQVGTKVLDALTQPFDVAGHELHISASIGISLYPDDGADVDTLMRTADTAMYHAKEKGRGNFQFFTEGLNRAAQLRLEVGKRLRHALFHDEFVLHYQPQVDMDNGRIFAAEALLRWQRPGQEPISCGAFIANAEESGLIVPIGEWTLREACRQLKSWRDAGFHDLKIAVNLSPRQLDLANFCTMLRAILNENQIPPNALELEITEGILMQRSDSTLSTLAELREMGVKLSVDDFGTGYSSLAYLQRFPVNALKIDQSFVRDIGTDGNQRALITAIIAMAGSLRLTVMAEGVETPEQVSFLLEHGCHCAQGYYYSAAVPAPAFTRMLESSPHP